MKEVLFITYFYPPISGSWRSLEFSRLLPEFGWHATVVSASENVAYNKDYISAERIPSDVQVYRVWHREPSMEWQYGRNRIRLNFDYLDYFKSWYRPALKQARKVLKEHKIDLIYSSASPVTGAFVAMKLKQETGIPWVCEFRDPWSGNDFLNIHYKRSVVLPLRVLLNGLIKRDERRMLEVSDRFVVVSPQQAQQLIYIHKDSATYASYTFGEKIAVVNNGYDSAFYENLESYRIYPNRTTITMLGTLYLGYQDIIAQFLQVVYEVDPKAQVVIMGGGAMQIKSDTPNLTRIAFVPKERALSLARGSDFYFLVTIPTAKWTLPTEIYDYLKLEKPILALVPPDGDAANIVRGARAGYVIPYDKEKMREALKHVFAQSEQGAFGTFQPDRDYIKQFDRRNLTKKLASVFDVAVREGKGR